VRALRSAACSKPTQNYARGARTIGLADEIKDGTIETRNDIKTILTVCHPLSIPRRQSAQELRADPCRARFSRRRIEGRGIGSKGLHLRGEIGEYPSGESRPDFPGVTKLGAVIETDEKRPEMTALTRGSREGADDEFRLLAALDFLRSRCWAWG
jgi:hypothetical protein